MPDNLGCKVNMYEIIADCRAYVGNQLLMLQALVTNFDYYILLVDNERNICVTESRLRSGD